MKFDWRTLIINLCGLVLAVVVAYQDSYFHHRIVGSVSPGIYWPDFVPVIVMFLIRRRALSYTLVALYLLLAIYQEYLVMKFDDVDHPIFFLQGIGTLHLIISVISLICLFVYLVVAIINWIPARNSKNKG
jgi:hypothetical protein